MAKSIRSKVKKRLRTVKRGVLKKELRDPSSKMGERTASVLTKLTEALSGDIKPGINQSEHAAQCHPARRSCCRVAS